MSYNVLVLTDHSGHSDQNSIYAILREMYDDPRCATIQVASRGLALNRGFFDSMEPNSLFAAPVADDFQYTPDGDAFSVRLRKVDIDAIDIVFMRLPRPVRDDFLEWLEVVFHKAVIVNSPRGIVETSSKEFLLVLADHCPPLEMVHSIDRILELASQQPIVLKPLREYGGRGVVKVDGRMINDGGVDKDAAEYLEALSDTIEQEGYLAMHYLRHVDQGDKRILVVDGEVMASSLRMPADGSWLCNVAQGGTSIASAVDDDERAIVAAISPILKQRGILIYGADTLMGNEGRRVLSEVNTLSIGGFPQAQDQSGDPIIFKTIQKIFDYASQRRR